MLTAVCVHGARRRRPVYVTNAEHTLLRLAGGRLGGVVCLVALAARAAATDDREDPTDDVDAVVAISAMRERIC